MIDLEFVKGKMGVEIKGEYYNVHPLPYDAGLMVVDEAYINLDLVMPYYGDAEAGMTKPGFYSRECDNGRLQLVIKEPNESEIEHYLSSKVITFEIDRLLEKIKSEDFMSPEEIERINMNSEFRKFDINPDDDFLKVIVKTVINTKKVNLKIYANRLAERHSLGNMISSLSGKTKMSVNYFQIWSELLGFDYKLTISDAGDDPIAPLKDDIYYDSIEGEVKVDGVNWDIFLSVWRISTRGI